MKSPICIFDGVPPRMWPTFKSCNISPATAEEIQTTAATPSTAATPCIPETPISTIRIAAITSAASVSPEMGLFDEPIMPDQVAGDGGEEEADDHHHDRGDNSRPP